MRDLLLRFSLAIVVFLLCAVPAIGQRRLEGEVRGTGQMPLADATVYLLRVADSTVLRTALTEADGRFSFEGLGADTVFVALQHAGYVPFYGKALDLGAEPELVRLPLLEMEVEGESKLPTVELVAKLPLVEHRIDRTIVNVDAMLTVSGGSAMDALERSPGVSVDQNGTIKLKGRGGVLVLIDDKPTYMSGTDLENYLRGLPASTLKQIELMPNPPAKYDAAGGGGVIVLRTKKNNVKGINGSISLAYRQGRYVKTGNSFNLNYRRNRFNLFSNFSYSDNTNFQDLYIDRNYLEDDGSPASFFRQRSYIKSRGQVPNGKVGIDYYVSDKTTIGVVANGFIEKGKNWTDNTSRVLDASETLNQVVYADNDADRNFRNGALNLNFRHQFDSSGRSLTFDADHVAYTNVGNSVFKNTVYSPGGDLLYSDRLDGELPSEIRIYAAKTDYEQTLPKGVILGAGLKVVQTNTDNAVFYERTIGSGQPAPDYSISNQFIYKERIGAAYLNLNKEWARISVQAGLRAEATRSTGNQLGNPLNPAQTFKRRYDNLFPTLYLSYKLDSVGNHQVNFQYGKRIDRPFFQDLNPFLSPLDKFTFYSGNPFLKPAFARTMALTYNYKSFFSATLNYNQSRGEINETLEIVDGIYYSRPGNIGSSTIANLALNANIPITKWYTFNAYSEIGHTRYLSKLYNQKLDAPGDYYYIQGSNQFQFGKGWSGEIGGDMISRFVSAQVTTVRSGSFNLGVKKVILHEKGSLRLSCSDPFYIRQFGGVINNLTGTYATYHSQVDSRVVSLSFNYRFGKPLGEQRRHDGSSAEGEVGRVKR